MLAMIHEHGPAGKYPRLPTWPPNFPHLNTIKDPWDAPDKQVSYPQPTAPKGASANVLVPDTTITHVYLYN